MRELLQSKKLHSSLKDITEVADDLSPYGAGQGFFEPLCKTFNDGLRVDSNYGDLKLLKKLQTKILMAINSNLPGSPIEQLWPHEYADRPSYWVILKDSAKTLDSSFKHIIDEVEGCVS